VDQRGDDGRVGEVYIIGTAPEHRGSGVGRWLLDEGLRRLEARDVAVAAVYVDESNGRALRVYEDAGFHHHHVDVCYARDLVARKLPVREEAAAAA
jgi:mycothiol synthase